MLYTEDHRNIMDSIRRFVSAEIDPHVDEWEAAEIFPAHELFKKMGVNVKCLGPGELMPLSAGGTQDVKKGLEGADAVMVLRIQKERLQKALSFTEEQYFEKFGLTAERLAYANEGAVVLHPGPMNRGVEIEAAIADDPTRSLITLQVEMGVAVRMACLDLLTRSAR